MLLNFVKYSGLGNDFILFDNRNKLFQTSLLPIRKLCTRKTGVGGDGILVLEASAFCDCRMRIFNADGTEAEMCGNGIRCTVDFLSQGRQEPFFCTIQTMHKQLKATKQNGLITVDMGNPSNFNWKIQIPLLNQNIVEASFLDTGVPHTVIFCDNIDRVDMSIAPEIRHHSFFRPAGTNVNFVQVVGGELKIRTFERGVESETLACGTGATAAAVVAGKKIGLPSPLRVKTLSGEYLTISFKFDQDVVTDVKMSGSCLKIFEGALQIDSDEQ